MISEKGIRVRMKGRVQGVLMRRGIKAEAEKLGIRGSAENKNDGTVEVLAFGTSEALTKLLAWCHKGSFLSSVSGIDFEWIELASHVSGFSIVRRGNYIEDKFHALHNLSKLLGTSDIVLPKHVAVIPDGNRRWAKEQNLSTFEGHKKGINNSIDLFNEARRLGIPYFTLWGFSTENWNRSEQEIKFLMQIFKSFLERLKKKFKEEEVRFHHFGRKDRLPKPIVGLLTELEKLTVHFKKGDLGLALDYGGRDEILRAVKKIEHNTASVSEEGINKALDTNTFPDVDFIIRTSGEQRLSGFMPWQGTYAELYFAKEHFPAFGVPEFERAIADFSRRKRNFGA